MSHIQFTKIAGKNFQSFENFELGIVPGKHLIIGENRCSGAASSNGSGKSTLLEVIVWTLYKKTQRGKDPSRNYAGDCWTMVEFVKDGNIYRAERYWKDKTFKNDLKLFMNGEDFSMRRKMNTEEELLKIIGIPHDLFISSVIVLQGLPMNFTAQTATVRKSTVEEMIGFSVWEDYRTKFDGAYREMDLERRQKEQAFLQSKEDMVKLNTRIETLKQTKQSSQEELQAQITAAEAKIKELEDLYAPAYAEMEKAKQAFETYGDLETLRSGIQHCNSRLYSLNKILSTGICSECSQDYPVAQVQNAKEEHEFSTKKLGQLQTKLGEAQSAKSLQDQHIKYVESLWQQISFNKGQLDALQQRANQQETSIDFGPMEQDLAGHLADVNGYRLELEDLNVKMENLKYLYDLMLPSSQFRTFVLEKYISYINQIMESIVPLVFDGVEFKMVVSAKGTGIELEIRRNGKEIEYKSMSGG